MKRIIVLLFCLLATPASAQIVNTLPFQLQNGTTADATQVMADFNQIVNNVNSSAAKNGSNSDITALLGLTTPIAPASGGSTIYVGGTGAGTANAQTIATVVPTGFTLAAGKRVLFVAGATNTGATTLNVASSGAVNVFKLTPSGSSALTGGEIVSGSIVEAVYDGTQYQLITNNMSVLGPLTNLTSASADLGSISSHNANITGTTTITSFGSTASTNYPIYYLTFVGALTLTYNASSMILPGAADITTAAGDTAIAQYLGSGNWKIAFYQRASGASVIATSPLVGAYGFTMFNNASVPNTSIDMAATSVVMANTSGVTITASGVSVTVNTTITGANGLDTGALASSTWYNFFLISNGTTTAGLASLSATTPTMPSGYTYKVRLGAMETDGSAHFWHTLQAGSDVSYVVGTNPSTMRQMFVENPTGVYDAHSVSGFVPPTATKVKFSCTVPGAATAKMAPNGNYGTGDPAPFTYVSSTAAVTGLFQGSMLLESTSIYAFTGASAITCYAVGWKDAVNAN